MSKTLSSVAVTEFDSMVKHAYQGSSLLRPAVTVRNNVVGDTYKFRNMGKGLANQKSTSDLVTPMDVSHSFATATLSNLNAPEYTDMFDAAEVNFDEKQELARTIAQSLGRRCDQLVIDAMDAETTYAATVVEGGTNLTTAKVIDAQVALRRQGVPNSELFAVVNAGGLDGLLNQEEVTSSDYANVKALVNGDVDTFGGFKFIVVEDRDEGGLPLPSTRTCFAFHRDAVGVGIGMNQKSEINYVPEKTSFLVSSMFSAGAVAIDAEGIVAISCTE